MSSPRGVLERQLGDTLMVGTAETFALTGCGRGRRPAQRLLDGLGAQAE
jgi:hypothetical protein